MTRLAGFHHVALTVTDLNASIEWYAAVLGFEELFREDGEHRKACVMRFPGGGQQVGLVQFLTGDEGGFDPHRIGLDHLAFAVATRAELDAWVERLSAAGVRHSGPIEVRPGVILNFKDPDGIALSLFCDRA